MVADLNHFGHPTGEYDHVPEKFQWIDCGDAEGQTLSFLKYGDRPEDSLMVTCNFSADLKNRDWGVPHDGKWKVLIDTSSLAYGGDSEAEPEDFQSFNEGRNDNYGLTPIDRLSVELLPKLNQAESEKL